MRLRTILLAGVVLAGSFIGALKAIDWLAPSVVVKPPVMTALPPLPAVRSSTIVVPIAVPLTAIRDLVERAAPRNFAGRADNPLPQLVQNAEIGWTAARGAITVTGAPNALALAAPVTGTITAKGSLSTDAKGAVGNALGKLLGGKVASQIGVNIKSLNANADIKGSIAMTARPTLLPNWRVEPNLTAQINLGDSSIAIAGARINVPAQVKPAIDKAVNDQLASLQQKIRSDAALETAARREWAKLCRAIPLQGAAVQGFWLELRPTRALAAQPRIDNAAVTLMLGIEAETRIIAAQTKPDCPFPATIQIVAPEAAGVKVAVPIDIPLSELDRIVEAQLVGKTFPEGGGASELTVKRASIAASGDRLLISLSVTAQQKSSLFGLAADASIFIWGKPVLDPAQQTLRLTDLQLAVESEAAFGLLGGAARAAVPYLQKALAEKAVIDLKPAGNNAQRRIGTMIADYQRNEEGLRVAAEISSLQLTDLKFDSSMIRVTAEADGFITVTVTTLPGP
jgi:hypothetical protein